MRVRESMIVSFVVVALLGCDQHPEVAPKSMATHDGRFNSSCNARSGSTNVEFCRISIFQLLGNVERYDNRHVEFVGYLGTVSGSRYIFPGEDAMRRWDLVSAISIGDHVDLKDGWVVAFGRFHAREPVRSDMYLGRLTEVEVSRR